MCGEGLQESYGKQQKVMSRSYIRIEQKFWPKFPGIGRQFAVHHVQNDVNYFPLILLGHSRTFPEMGKISGVSN